MLQVWQAADASDESGVWKVYQYVREGASGLADAWLYIHRKKEK